MKLLQKATNNMAFFKCGILGFQGTGKTFTSSLLAIGLVKEHGLKKPVAFVDTETGSDFMIPKFNDAGIELVTAKTRAFADLLKIIDEAEKECSVLIVDSITHIWRDLTESYCKKLKRTRLQFQDWNPVKGEWGKYTDAFVNSSLHIIVCGRAGYEYDYDFNEDGSKDLIKTGTKMKAESEFGFEPSLVIEMDRSTESHVELDALKDRAKKQAFKPKVGSRWIHKAIVLKDRCDVINGQVFSNPTYKDFKPHIDCLNIGGKQLGVDTTRDSQSLFDHEGRPDWKVRATQKQIVLEEITAELDKKYVGRSDKVQIARGNMIEYVFGTRSKTKIENMSLEELGLCKTELLDLLADAFACEQIETGERKRIAQPQETVQAPPQEQEETDVPVNF